ncbi:hypothetical protein [Streptomyces sp. NPDC088725]|uniref:hypothetical protein n=1 Tax=Streptomyces sp. NPDC088725 TaxID=3365873 RepID=UPI0037F7DB09
MNSTHSTGTTGAGGARWRRSPLAAVTVTAAVLVAAGGGAWLATSASGSDHRSGAPAADGNPPPLALDGHPGPAPGGPGGPPPNGIAPGEPDPHGVVYRARGALPEGPDSARVYRTEGDVGAADVTRLARALGLTGTPRTDGTTWKVGAAHDGSGPVLRVQKQEPGAWTYDLFGPSKGGDNCLKGRSGCPGTGSGTGAGTGNGSAVSEAAARKAAAPVLKALGQDDAKIDAHRLRGAVRLVNADPVIGGLPTYGWATGLQVGADGGLLGGSGQLNAPDPGDEYPVIGAAEALKQLNTPRVDSGSGGCATAVPAAGRSRAQAPCTPQAGAARAPVTIEKAVFGLAVHSVEGRRTLVPSWLFEAAPGGGAPSYTLAQPAVAPRFLTRPAPPHKELPGGPASAGPGQRRVTSYSAEGRTLTLRFWGGVCGEYGVSADESGTAVKVKVTGPVSDPPDGKEVCVALAKEVTARTTLDRPLGGRQVVDGVTGDVIPLG